MSAVTRHLRIIENRLTVLYAQRDVLREVLGDDRPKVLRPRDAKATYGIIAEVRENPGRTLVETIDRMTGTTSKDPGAYDLRRRLYHTGYGLIRRGTILRDSKGGLSLP